MLSTSDDFFASKDNLIKPWVSRAANISGSNGLETGKKGCDSCDSADGQPSVSMKGQFGPTGALYDGWESRRHNPSFDW